MGMMGQRQRPFMTQQDAFAVLVDACREWREMFDQGREDQFGEGYGYLPTPHYAKRLAKMLIAIDAYCDTIDNEDNETVVTIAREG